MAPPHPDFQETYQRTRNQNRKLQQSNSTLPQRLLDSETCHDLSDEECFQWNEQINDHSRKLTGIRERTGLYRPLVLLMKFTDHLDRVLPSKNDIDELWNGFQTGDNYPTGSIRDYFDTNSLGLLNLDARIMDWKTTDNTEDYYSFGVSGKTKLFARAIHTILDQLDAEGIDFGEYDLDNDLVIDAIVVMTSSSPAELGQYDCFSRSYENRIWSHTIQAFSQNYVTSTGYSIGPYTVASVLRGTCGGEIARLGVVTHELVHTWGVPDLYDTTSEEPRVGKGVGTYDIMGNPYGLNGMQDYPNHLSAWTKIKSGWAQPKLITEDGVYQIDAAELSNEIYKFAIFPTEEEYLLIENRQPTYWDALFTEGGLLIWHIDESADSNNNRGYPGQQGWPSNGMHYMVALEQADRNYGLENGYDIGGSGDFWVNGSEYTYSTPEASATDYRLYPNSNSYRHGIITSTFLKISDISPSGNVMTFRVSGLSPATPQPSKPPASAPDPPTSAPSALPSEAQLPTTNYPTRVLVPTVAPSVVPPPGITFHPSLAMTKSPSRQFQGDIDFSYFTNTPTVLVTNTPSTTVINSIAPTTVTNESDSPSTSIPVAVSVSLPSISPSASVTVAVPVSLPSLLPSAAVPSNAPISAPVGVPAVVPVSSPSIFPSAAIPVTAPIAAPVDVPVAVPVSSLSLFPTTAEPSNAPISAPVKPPDTRPPISKSTLTTVPTTSPLPTLSSPSPFKTKLPKMSFWSVQPTTGSPSFSFRDNFVNISDSSMGQQRGLTSCLIAVALMAWWLV